MCLPSFGALYHNAGSIHVQGVTMAEEKTVKTENEDRYEAKVKRVSRLIRHIGFALFGGSAFLMMVFLMVSVVKGVNAGEVRDPFTGEKVQTEQSQPDAQHP